MRKREREGSIRSASVRLNGFNPKAHQNCYDSYYDSTMHSAKHGSALTSHTPPVHVILSCLCTDRLQEQCSRRMHLLHMLRIAKITHYTIFSIKFLDNHQGSPRKDYATAMTLTTKCATFMAEYWCHWFVSCTTETYWITLGIGVSLLTTSLPVSC